MQLKGTRHRIGWSGDRVSNPDFLLGGRTSASAKCRHWSEGSPLARAILLRPAAQFPLTGTHPRVRKFRPGLGAALAAGGTDKAWLNIRQPDVVGPAVGTDLDMVAASVIAAIDQQSGDGPRHRVVSRTFSEAHGAVAATDPGLVGSCQSRLRSSWRWHSARW